MSRLKLYWPDARGQHNAAVQSPVSNDSETIPAVIPFSRRDRWSADDSQTGDALERALTIHTNSHCPACRHPVVEPIELNDAAIGRSNLPIPGTATLVGFRCTRCESEWQA